MVNKLSSIDNACYRQKILVDLVGEIYLITSSDAMWNKWKEVLEKHKTRELIDPNIGRVSTQHQHSSI